MLAKNLGISGAKKIKKESSSNSTMFLKNNWETLGGCAWEIAIR